MAQKQVTICAGDVSDEAQEWLKQHGAKIEGFGLLTITLPEQAKVYHGSRGWDYSLSFYGADGNNEESYIDVELDLDAYETRLQLKYEGDRQCSCKGRGCVECIEELAAQRRGENPYAHHTTPILACIETSMDPAKDARVRVLLPTSTGVLNLPAYNVQDADEALEIVKAAYPVAQIVEAHALDEEVYRRQPPAQPGPVVEEALLESEF